jgi:putative transposase
MLPTSILIFGHKSQKIISCKSPGVVGWTLSNTLDAQSCIRTLEKAIDEYGLPDVINSDQGSQFTGDEWIQALQFQGILISMSGRGRSNDNAHIERLWRTLKYEWTLINGVRTVADYKKLLPQFIQWYNNTRPHQSLNYQTPFEVLKQMPYRSVDKASALPTDPQGQKQPMKTLLF